MYLVFFYQFNSIVILNWATVMCVLIVPYSIKVPANIVEYYTDLRDVGHCRYDLPTTSSLLKILFPDMHDVHIIDIITISLTCV